MAITPEAAPAPDPIILRTTSASDGPLVRELRLEAITWNPTAFGAGVQETEEIDWTERAARGDGSGHEAIFIAERNRQALGMCGIVGGTGPKDKHAALIWGVYVRPAWRGMRIADRLVNAAVEWARQKELAIVRLTVVSDNAKAIASYQRCGFQITGTERAALAWEGRYYDELLMCRWLVDNRQANQGQESG
jgi:RimJ/RimL family protein N-acetyltransferase